MSVTDVSHQKFTSQGLIRRLLAYAAIGTFLGTLSSAALTGLWLYGRLEQSHTDHLFQEAQQGNGALVQYLELVKAVSQQIASRTQARQLLAQYNAGELSSYQLQQSTAHLLEDALAGFPQALGITRLDSQGREAVLVGRTIPERYRPVDWADSPGPWLVSTMEPPLIMVRVPIFHQGQFIGTDLVSFSLEPVLDILAQPNHPNHQAYLAYTESGVIRLLTSDPTATDLTGRSRWFEANHLPLPELTALTHGIYGPLEQAGSYYAVLPVIDNGWYLIMVHPPIPLINLWPDIGWWGGISLMLSSLAVLGLLRLLRPLAGTLLFRADTLAEEVARRTASLQRYTRLVAALGEVTYELQLHQKTIHWDGGYQTWLGYDATNMGHYLKDWLQRIHPGDLATVIDAFTQANQQDRPLDIRYRVRHADGHYLWVQERAIFTYDSNGTPLTALGIIRDITAQQQQEQQLRREKEALRSYLDQAGVMIAIVRRDRSVALVNRKTCQMLGWPEAEVVGRDWIDNFLPPSHRRSMGRIFSRVLSRGLASMIEKYEHPLLSATGEERLVAWRGTLLYDDAGQPIAILTAGEDITEHRRLEQEWQVKAQLGEEAKNKFVTQMSHEMRTPLTAILGFAELLRDNAPPATRDEAISALLHSGQHLQGLVDDVLNVSKAEADQLAITKAPLNPAALLDDWYQTMVPLAQAKGLELSLHRLTSLPASIYSDARCLSQILNKLGSNAIKFTNQGAVRLLVSYDSTSEHLILTLFDSGIGISTTHQEHVFQPFVQADTSAARRYGGTGLGLYLARELARRLGGDLILQSHPEVGSIFVTTIATREESPASPVSSPPQVAGRILLVEDNRYNQQLISHHLAKTGAQIVIAENGEEALSLALEEEFQLILMDLQMPVMDGLEATRLLRDTLYPGPIVALTAHALGFHREQALEAGCDLSLIHI